MYSVHKICSGVSDVLGFLLLTTHLLTCSEQLPVLQDPFILMCSMKVCHFFYLLYSMVYGIKYHIFTLFFLFKYTNTYHCVTSVWSIVLSIVCAVQVHILGTAASTI
jgi:hypothetical protein